MTETADTLEPLPVGGPAGVPAVKVRLSIDADDHGDDVELGDLVAAVNYWIRGDEETGLDCIPVVDRVRGKDVWPPNIVLGANMLCGRLWRRKGTPGGVEVFGDAGVAFVRRNDPDIGMLLQLGDDAKPSVS